MSDALLEALGSTGDVLITIDFETYFSADYNLRKCTTEGYVRDPRFQVLGCGVKVAGGPSTWLEEWEFRAWAERVDWSRVAVLAHHAQFDAFILSHHYGIRPRFLLCTMSMARAVHGVAGVGLDNLAKVYGLGEKGTELKIAKGKRREQLTQAEWALVGGYCRNDVDLTAGLLRKMLPKFPEPELWVVDTTIRAFTEPVFVGDQAVLVKALEDERAKKSRVLARIVETTRETDARAVLSSSDKFAALLRALGEEPPVKPNDKGEDIYAFAKDDPGMQALLEHPRDEIRAVAEARLAIKSTIIETRTERIIGAAKRGAIPFYIKFCGTHTHRMSGGDKMNPQNFNRGGALRDAILAPEGHALVVVDSGQIEARVLPWFAGEQRLLETFRRNDANGGDFYADEGTAIFQKPVSKKETPLERQIAKAMLLGLGFQMGWGRFAGELLKGMLGADPVQFTRVEVEKFKVDVAAFAERGYGNVTNGQRVQEMISNGQRLPFDDLLVHCAVANHFVWLYRMKNPNITRLWKTAENVLSVMAADTNDGGAVRMRWGCLSVVREGLVKPSGLTLLYPGLRRSVSSGFSYLGGPRGVERTHVYGGLLVENVVQSLARDIVMEQSLWIRADGARIGTTTHDEVVAVVPKDQAEQAYQRALARMRTSPAWCADLPLNASGGFGTSYGAVK